ncbi:hypothetical protein PICST_51421 [Scheffersomyces stipitis CBS 6054]|uniref:SBE2/SBE22 middle domain-containing protein n=1 Tax=Scheffersomyces stipitis (strain ATCC 58785 / CBS 6054 / NBRC 10063 / NRRL Y-11545) TaxID=322104 RepID=A3GF10_PICST|nr:hypothetical protein PICST_51421 [Scheffersomyces stipitis CBS 6054]EAZ63675.2 hypothetical protein PICST_51421 [Scheffersomyces stipitis CBS 6054]
MKNTNASSSSLDNNNINNNNYYDIAISLTSNSSIVTSGSSSSKKSSPKRVSSMSALTTLNEVKPTAKRPGDYYIQKLSQSSLSLITANSHSQSHKNDTVNGRNYPRPRSGESLASLRTSYSDEVSSIVSSQFDTPIETSSRQSQNMLADSRLSSLTSNSIAPSEAPSINNFNFTSSTTITAEDGDCNSCNSCSNDHSDYLDGDSSPDITYDHNCSTSSISTLSTRNSSRLSSSSSFSHSHSARNSKGNSKASHPVTRSYSTSNIKQRSTSSSPSLSRSKTRYISSKEIKERQMLRKKKYDENDDDEEILTNELDNLVFNVPVIKNHSELYLLSSSSSAMLSRSDLMTDNDNNKYNINGSIMKPCPLPGKLGSQTDLSIINSHGNDLTQDSIVEEAEGDDTMIAVANLSMNDDSEISNNISQFYNQRSTSMSKIAKLSREQTMMYKLPNFVKSQSSMEDLHLISLEKLNLIDQTRPINLPPKSGLDKSKHNREFQKVLTNFELNTKNLNDARNRSSQIHAQNQQLWMKYVSSLVDEETTSKQFNKKFSYEKNAIRKLAWDSNIPSAFRFQFFMQILSHNNNSQDSVHTINNSFTLFDQKYQNLSDTIRKNKDVEFNNIVDVVLHRPMFDAILKEVSSSSTFSLASLKDNFKYLLYIKSLSEYGLHKHDQVFLIPVLLVLFQNTQSLQEIYCLLELINQQILNRDFLSTLNGALGNWSDLKNLSSHPGTSSTYLSKFLSKLNNLDEFDKLNSNSFFEILLQFNDKLPLSLSAPSTPIMNHPGQFSFTHSPSSSSNLSCASNLSDGNNNSNINNSDNITPRTSVSGSDDFVDINSSALQLMIKLLQLLIIHSNSVKSKDKNNMKIVSTFLVVTFQFYHINWNSFQELIKLNKSIRLNKTADQVANLDAFVEKWKDSFGRF